MDEDNNEVMNDLSVLSLVQTPIVMIGNDWEIEFVNDYGLALLGAELEEVKGKKCYDLIRTGHCQTSDCACRRAMQSGKPMTSETRSEGLGAMCIKYFATPLLGTNGEVKGCVETIIDITELKRREEIITQQTQEIMELSTPVIQVWKGVVAAPLIGTLDSHRTQQFMERLLERIVQTNSEVALVDITGVPTIDTQTAQHIIETITAVRLLGADVILTGVRPAIAQTLVHLGIDLSNIITRSSLSAGLKVAMHLLDLKIVPRGEDNKAR